MTRSNRIDGLGEGRGDNVPLSQTEKQRRLNPRYIPPTGRLCPIERLPPEVLASVFELGTRASEASEVWDMWDGDEEDVDFDDWGEEEELNRNMPGSFPFPFKEPLKENYDTSKETAADEDKTRDLPFQVRASHVCRRWRQIALQMPTLWTTLDFSEPQPFQKNREYLERSKQCPLDLLIDVSVDETGTPALENQLSFLELPAQFYETKSNESMSTLSKILDLVIPHVYRWRTFELTVSEFTHMVLALIRLEGWPANNGAPLLQSLRLYCHEADDDTESGIQALNGYKKLYSPFGGNAPKLLQVELWGVHLDWKILIPRSEQIPVSLNAAPSAISNLTELELAYHIKDVRPPYADFINIIRCSPKLESLKLASSGPGPRLEGQHAQPLFLPNLRHLSLGYVEEDYAISLWRLLYTPALTSIALDFDEGDYTNLVKELVEKMRLPNPLPGYFDVSAKSREVLEDQTRLSNVTYAKLGGLPCDRESAYTFYAACRKLEHLHLNMHFVPFSFFSVLIDKENSPQVSANGAREGVTLPNVLRKESPLCKQLAKLTVSGVLGKVMVKFVKERKALGVPVRKLEVDRKDDYTHEDLDWLSNNVLESLNIVFFSDDEEEDVWVDDDDDDELGMEWDDDSISDDEDEDDEEEGHFGHAGTAGEDYWGIDGDESDGEAEDDDDLDEDGFYE